MSAMKLFEQIEDYLMNRLSSEARQAFEAEMAADPALRKEVALHRDMMQAIEDEDDIDLEEQPSKDILDLRELMGNAYQAFQSEKTEEDPAEQTKPASGKSWMRYFLISAVLLLAAFGIWWTQSQPDAEIGKNIPVAADTLPTSPQKPEPIAQTTPPPVTAPDLTLPPAEDYAALAQAAYKDAPFDAGTLMSGGDEPDETPLQKASEAYAKKLYRETADLLKNLPEEGRTDALKLRAHAQFQLKRYERAAADFEELTKSLSYRNDAEWYLLLCHAARLPKTKTAYETLLAKVSTAGHPFEQRAKRLSTLIDD